MKLQMMQTLHYAVLSSNLLTFCLSRPLITTQSTNIIWQIESGRNRKRTGSSCGPTSELFTVSVL